MDISTKEIFEENFWLNPVFFLEISRIKSGIAEGVILQKIFEPDSSALKILNSLFHKFLKNEIDVSELFMEVMGIERKIIRYCMRHNLFKVIRALEVELVPIVVFTNRILRNPPLSPDIQFFVFEKNSKRYIRKIRKIERRVVGSSIDFEDGRERLMRVEGRILGYPKCCIESYIEGKRNMSAENRIVIEGIDQGIFDSLLESFRNSWIVSFPQFFTSNFYPCSVCCENATKVGLAVEQWLEYEHFVTAFRVRTMVNALYLLVSGYKAFKSQSRYGKMLAPYFSSVGRDDLELISIIQEHISDITSFTNIFMSRILSFSKQGRSV